MTEPNKLIERIETNLQIKCPSPRFVQEIIHYLKQKLVDIHPSLNITFEQDGDSLKININCIGTANPFLKALDVLLIHIREKKDSI
jgi:hypothetical protein